MSAEETDREKQLMAKISELENRLAAAHPWRNQLVMIPRAMPDDFNPATIAGSIENALDFSECSDEFTLGARSAIAEIARYLTEHREEIKGHYRAEINREKAWERQDKRLFDNGPYGHLPRYKAIETLENGDDTMVLVRQKSDGPPEAGAMVAIDLEPYRVKGAVPAKSGKVWLQVEFVSP